MAGESGKRSFGALRLVASAANGTAAPRRPLLDDEALLAGMREGLPHVAGELCDRLWPPVDRTIGRLLGRRDSDSEDLAQIALMEIVNTIDRYRGDCSLDRWAQTVTAHVVFKHLRRRTLERRLFSELLSDDAHAGPQHIELTSVSRALLGRIAICLDGMNATRAWAFLLHDVIGYDLQEIAAMLKISLAAAQSRLSRGRRELHSLFEQDPELAGLIQKVTRAGLEQATERGQGEDEP